MMESIRESASTCVKNSGKANIDKYSCKQCNKSYASIVGLDYTRLFMYRDSNAMNVIKHFHLIMILFIMLGLTLKRSLSHVIFVVKHLVITVI